MPFATSAPPISKPDAGRAEDVAAFVEHGHVDDTEPDGANERLEVEAFEIIDLVAGSLLAHTIHLLTII